MPELHFKDRKAYNTLFNAIASKIETFSNTSKLDIKWHLATRIQSVRFHNATSIKDDLQALHYINRVDNNLQLRV